MNLIILVIRYTFGSLLIGLFSLISSKLRLRAKLERSSSRHLKEITAAKIWFHCSSEGELEQVWPIIENIEQTTGEPQLIWFTSSSLLAKAQKVNERNSSIHMAYLPLVSLFPNKQHPLRYGKPELFFMVRYDFFAELLAVGSYRAQKFVLLSATFKGKINGILKNAVKRMLAKRLYSCFDEIYFSTKRDLDFYKLNCQDRYDQKVSCHDFRHGQIMLRQQERTNLKESRCLGELRSLLENYDMSDRLIIGSAWASELEIFTPEFLAGLKAKKHFVFIAPHKLKGEQWDQFELWFEDLREKGLEVCLWDHIGFHGSGNIILCQRPGLLCELYPYFGHSFVGGGHGRSVHSLLEPFWGNGHIYCGPRTQRSTEYDFVLESAPAHIHIVGELKDFYDSYKDKRTYAQDFGAREKLGLDVLKEQKEAVNSFYQGERA